MVSFSVDLTTKITVILFVRASLCGLMLLTESSYGAFSQATQRELTDLKATMALEAPVYHQGYASQVWLLDMSKRLKPFVKNARHRLRILKAVYAEAILQDLPPELILALIEVESAFQSYALSSAGAMGYMQVMPFWKKYIGRVDDNLMELSTNLRYGCTILKHYYHREGGNWVRALARYNGSVGQLWYPERVLKAWEKRWYVHY